MGILRILIFLVLISCITSQCFSKEIKYPYLSIPKYLLNNSKAVIRNHSIEYEFITTQNAVKKVHFAITIINANGLSNANFTQFYNKFSKIVNFTGHVYNQYGEILKTISKSSIQDFSAISQYSLYEDQRVAFVDIGFKDFPFTVEYSFEIQYSGLLNPITWSPIIEKNIAVEKSNFKVIYPNNLKINYIERNLDQNGVKSGNIGDKKIFQWSFSNLTSVINQPFSLPIEDYLPIIIFEHSQFTYNNLDYDWTSWQNIGFWELSLISGKDKLNPVTSEKIVKMVEGIDNDLEKVKILYQYMQNRTRYVSIQIGMGGWIPIEADLVDEYGYGDCKALTNYMLSILKVAGIKSYYTLINTGENTHSLIKEFPSTQFNHALLVVPLKEDTIWLECTNPNLPFGYTGTFTDDRDALMVTENGGILVHTKSMSINDNSQNRKIKIDLDSIFTAHVTMQTRYKGLFYDENIAIVYANNSDKEEIILNKVKYPSLSLISFSFNESRSRIPYFDETLKMSIQNCGQIINNRVLIPVLPFYKDDFIPVKMTNRTSDIFIKRSFQMIDTMEFIIPSNVKINQLPENKSIENDFGSISLTAYYEQGKVIFVKRVRINKGIFLADRWDEFVEFNEKIQLIENTKFVLLKNN